MILFPNAKINLGLHVLSKREDQYHNLETHMYPIGLCDILEFLPSPQSETIFKLSGIPISGDTHENLVYKAYLMLKERFKLPNLNIHLHKIIPAGAGLGGGSSDTAFMLIGLNKMFGLNLDSLELKNLADSLGSDCSFFIGNMPAFVSGKGEILKPSQNYLKNYKILLFFPGFPVATAEAYRGIMPDSERSNLSIILEKGIGNWKDLLKNDFEKIVFKQYPEIGELKEKLYKCGAVYASMSGSGSSVYGIFEKDVILTKELQKYFLWKS